MIGDVLKRGNLIVNPTKTENTVIRRQKKNEESWRKSKKLGSLLGDVEDITNRKNLSIAASINLNKIWIRKGKITLKRRLHLYNSIVKPVLLYNSETWGLSRTDIGKLDAFHRQQLRIALNIRYPNKISNKALYRRCEAEPITFEIIQRRWRFFGHALRLDRESPAQKSMDFFFECKTNKSFRGRPRTTIISTINDDINRLNDEDNDFRNVLPTLKTEKDLDLYRITAQDRKYWKKLSYHIHQAAKTERFYNEL